MPSILLKGGVVLVHGDEDKVTPTQSDILVQGDRISKIEASITAPPDCTVIDCSDKIISPGFVDTHHHIWEAPMKGLFADSTLLAYLAAIYAAGLIMTPQDLWWANLGGSMEALDAGTTTTLDHAHLNWTSHHSSQALAGTISSGIRSIFAYTPTFPLLQTKPSVEFAPNPMADWVMETFEKLAKARTLNDPKARVYMGFGFDFYFLPKEFIVSIFDKAKSLGAKIITSHYIRPHADAPSVPAILKDYGLLDETVVLSHAGGATVADVKLLTEANTYVSVTPNSEQSMAVGPSMSFRDDLPGIEHVCSLGIDISSANSGSIVNEMRTSLQFARGVDSAAHHKENKLPRRIYHTTAEAFNMGTIQGARALRLEEDIGSIAVGKKADLAIFDALNPAMACAAQQDPVAAIVMHSSIGDIDTVIVDGEVRKRDGKLLPVRAVEWQDAGDFVETDRAVTWSEVAKRMLATQKRLVTMLQDHDLDAVEKALTALLQLPS